MNIVLTSILSALGGGIFKLLLLVFTKFGKMIKAIVQAVKALSHDATHRQCRAMIGKERISEADMENLNFLYNTYRALGMNGTVEKMYEEIKQKPTDPVE